MVKAAVAKQIVSESYTVHGSSILWALIVYGQVHDQMQQDQSDPALG
jgi:hypothetical protein